MSKNKGIELFDDIPVPEKLLPENIATMLKKSKNNSAESVKDNNQITVSSTPVVKKKKKINKTARVFASFAACAVLVAGIAAFINSRDNKVFKGVGFSFKTELSKPQDYSEVYNTFNKIYASSDKAHYSVNDFFNGLMGETAKDGSVMYEEKAAAPSDTNASVNTTDSNSKTTNNNYSETHQQVKGVEEADVIKTDGNRIYYVANSILYIVESNNGQMKLLSKMENEGINAREIYIKDNKIILISDKRTQMKNPVSNNGIFEDTITKDIVMPNNFDFETMVQVLDVKDGAKPVAVSSYNQKGSYISSRMIDNNLYITSTYYNNSSIKDEKDIDKYIPTYQMNEEKCYVDPENISIPEKCDNTNYTILAGLDITAEKPLISIQALLGYNGIVYSSLDNFYVAGAKWDDNKQQTTIARFSMDKGNVKHTGFGTVDGVALNQFSMDENDGYFRIATTSFNNFSKKQTSGVYVLDKDMKQVGELSGLAERESIKSVRFDKNIVYIVTFRQTDPLFKIDLSNPNKPKLVSELKINGYSSYMVNFGDGKLLGFGVDANDKGRQTGLKLSMFSTTNGGEDVKEITSLTLDKDLQNAWSEALSNHKALLIDAEKKIIGIPVSFYSGIDQCNRYYLFKYSDEKGFEQVGKIETHDATGVFTFGRGMYINDVVYAFSYGRIVSAKIADMKVISSLELLPPTAKGNTTNGSTGKIID